MMWIYTKNNSDNVTGYLAFHCMIKFQKCKTYALSLGIYNIIYDIIENVFRKTKLTLKQIICLIENSKPTLNVTLI